MAGPDRQQSLLFSDCARKQKTHVAHLAFLAASSHVHLLIALIDELLLLSFLPHRCSLSLDSRWLYCCLKQQPTPTQSCRYQSVLFFLPCSTESRSLLSVKNVTYKSLSKMKTCCHLVQLLICCKSITNFWIQLKSSS